MTRPPQDDARRSSSGGGRPRAMRILIVGGGIAGLSMARALARAGLAGEIVERQPAWEIAGAGVYLPGNGMAALRELGLAVEVAALGTVIERRRLRDDRGRMLVDFDEAGFWSGLALPIGLHRLDLHGVLAGGASETPIRFGVTVEALTDRGHAVEVRFSDGATDTYDLVVGADGIHSTTRRLVFGGPDARFVGQAGWRFVVDGFPDIDGWNGWIGADRGFLALGIGGGRVYCFGDVRAKDPADPSGGDPA